ncbi:hypothetical protein ACWDTP_17495 [Mycobacterium sp. NPDC003449]
MEAEEAGVEWLRWAGFSDAHRLGDDLPEGISGTGVRAVATFDPLPMDRSSLISVHRWADQHEARAVSFSFAGWTSDSFEMAEELEIALLRYTFAGTIEPDNVEARRLAAGARRPARPAPDRKTH